MRGDLGTSSVVDLCRGLAEASSTGTVELTGPDGSGNIIFRNGRVVWARSPAPRARLGDRLVNAALLSQEQLDHALEVQARSDDTTKLGALLVEQGLVTRDVIRVFVQEQILDAVFDLMRWREGSYEFHPGEAVDEKLPVDIPVDQLLVEVSRRQSEWDEIERAIPDLDMVPDFRTGGSSAAASLEPDEFAVLANVDGQRSIRELADHLGYSEFEAARIVYGLTLLGVVSVGHDGQDEQDEGTPVEQVEAEFDLAPEEETDPDVDVGLALEEALSVTEEEERRPPPAVRVHVDDEGHFPVPEVEEEPPAEEDDYEEPEPWTPEDVEVVTASDYEPAPEVDLGVDEDEAATPPREDLDDEDFETLINQLAGAPEPAEDDDPPAAEPDRPDEPEPDVEERGPADEAEEEAPPAAPSEDRGTSDVSEFLRELSRLAVEEDDGREAPASERPAERPARREEPPPPQRDDDDRSDDKKKKGFFGWGR